MRKNYKSTSQVTQILKHIKKMCERKFDDSDYFKKQYACDDINAYLSDIRIYSERALRAEENRRTVTLRKNQPAAEL